MDDFRIPKPLSNIGCQDLLTMEPVYSGWLRYKLEDQLRDIPLIGGLMKRTVYKMKSRWTQLYVIIQRGCVYFFNKDTSTKPRFALSLFEYNKVQRAQDEFKQPGLHAFKLVHVNDSCRYFSASSNSERKTWISKLNMSMREANNKPSISASIRRSDSIASGGSTCSTLSELEEPIYNRDEMGLLRNHSEIGIYNEDIEETYDLEDQDTYDEFDDPACNGQAEKIDQIDEMNDDPDQKDTLATNLNKILLGSPMPPLPQALVTVDSDIPSDPAPAPPMDASKKSAQGLSDRQLPKPPSPTSPYLQTKWETLISSGKDIAPPKSPRLLPGAVPIFMPLSPPEKPDVPKKPESMRQKSKDEIVLAMWEGERSIIKSKLYEIAKEGVFAIRNSENAGTSKVLVVFVDGDLKQYKMGCDNGKWYLFPEKLFENMKELLIYYQRNYLPNTSNYLTKPFRCYSTLS